MSDLTNAPESQPGQTLPLRVLSAGQARARLEAESGAARGAGERRRQRALAISAIETVESLFQPREIAEYHVTGMVKDANAGGLPALLVWWTGARAVLLDGHHRREAYKRAKVTEAVPVEWFEGDLEHAIAEAGARNCQEKLPMNTPQRMNLAWRLVCFTKLSKADIRRATAAGDGQIAAMRRVLRTLEAGEPTAAENYRTWQQAQEAIKGRKGWTGMDEDEIAAHKEALAREWTRRMGKAVGTKLAGNPEIAAMALAGLLGRKLPEVVTFLLKEHVNRDELAEGLADDDFPSDF